MTGNTMFASTCLKVDIFFIYFSLFSLIYDKFITFADYFKENIDEVQKKRHTALSRIHKGV